MTYSVTATATNSLGLSSEPKSISFIKPSVDTGLSVKLVGPRKIHADRNLEIKAEISQCNTSDAGLPTKYRVMTIFNPFCPGGGRGQIDPHFF